MLENIFDLGWLPEKFMDKFDSTKISFKITISGCSSELFRVHTNQCIKIVSNIYLLDKTQKSNNGKFNRKVSRIKLDVTSHTVHRKCFR